MLPVPRSIPQKAREMTAAAGFGRFTSIDYEGDIFNAFYEIRP